KTSYGDCELVEGDLLVVPPNFFFFQAEDGIRDRNVTGVQTCALPICPLLPSLHSGEGWAGGPPRRGAAGGARHAHAVRGGGDLRSEERRVGKECRFRWWAWGEKKKRINIRSVTG